MQELFLSPGRQPAAGWNAATAWQQDSGTGRGRIYRVQWQTEEFKVTQMEADRGFNSWLIEIFYSSVKSLLFFLGYENLLDPWFNLTGSRLAYRAASRGVGCTRQCV